MTPRSDRMTCLLDEIHTCLLHLNSILSKQNVSHHQLMELQNDWQLLEELKFELQCHTSGGLVGKFLSQIPQGKVVPGKTRQRVGPWTTLKRSNKIEGQEIPRISDDSNKQNSSASGRQSETFEKSENELWEAWLDIPPLRPN